MRVTLEARRRRARVVVDEDAENPRDEEFTFGTIVAWCRSYTLGDVQPEITPREWEARLDMDTVCVILPVYLFMHSNLRVSTTPFRDRFDSGRLGSIYCTWDAARTHFESLGLYTGDLDLIEQARNALIAEVYAYDAYLNFEVYELHFEVETHIHGGWVTEDRTVGYYGTDIRRNGMIIDGDMPHMVKLVEEAIWEA